MKARVVFALTLALTTCSAASEVDRGLWHVLDADEDMVFRKDSGDSMWEELLRRARAVTASLHAAPALG